MNASGRVETVSVIMPTFNRGRFLREAIDSVLAQSHAPLEVLVVDDGSTDDTRAICASYGSAITYLASENRGKSAAINLGLNAAAGDFIWVMDDDDIAPAGALAGLLAPLLSDASLGFSFGRLRAFRDTARGRRWAPVAAPPEDGRSLFVRLMEDCFITGQPCTLIRRDCYRAIGPLDETIVASVDYNILLAVARRFQGAAIDAVVVLQRQHDGARGPARLRYKSHQRTHRWRTFDRRIVGELLPTLSAEEFLGEAPSGRMLSPLEHRRASFQRAAIAGRKELWDAAVAALVAGRQVAADPTLSALESEILGQTLGSRYGIDVLLRDRGLQRGLVSAAGAGDTGREIRLALARPLTYRIRHALLNADAIRLVLNLSALVRLCGVRRAARLTLAAASRRFARWRARRSVGAQQFAQQTTITTQPGRARSG
ncbi:glycosyltransferase family 2 protein [Phenylobacterium sp.]|uniref:glycosyltransferase family 2 protein n=1 Tax=Phenylobacterium sp. TaxID=1871053 RepID=UPI002735BEC1|nr:glycosyltransferase family 2 protein [Phenylobacterium sp.]